jgi:hypothetical protein
MKYVEKSNTLVPSSTPKFIEQERLLPVLRAVIDTDLASVLVLVRKTDESPAVTFFAITGALSIFETHVLNQRDKHDYVHTCFSPEYVFDHLTELCDRLLELIKNENYIQYPTVATLDPNEQKNDFFSKMFCNLYIYVFEQISQKKISKYIHEFIFKVLYTMEKILCVIQSCVLIDSDHFFKNTFLPKVEQFLDSFCVECFSSTQVQIFNAKRAAYEYILRSVVFCNPYVDQSIVAQITKRWNTWFIFEKQYKIGTKQFDREHLREEMLRFNL